MCTSMSAIDFLDGNNLVMDNQAGKMKEKLQFNPNESRKSINFEKIKNRMTSSYNNNSMFGNRFSLLDNSVLGN